MEELNSARVDKINNSLLDALIKMMLVDSVIHEKELEHIAEIYFLLFGSTASMQDLEDRILRVSEEEDLNAVGELANSIANSIRSKSSKEVATYALIDVMISDKEVHENEANLIKKIAELWGTTNILDKVLNDS